jgi:Na+/H+ antiporter NhaC
VCVCVCVWRVCCTHYFYSYFTVHGEHRRKAAPARLAYFFKLFFGSFLALLFLGTACRVLTRRARRARACAVAVAAVAACNICVMCVEN